LSSSRQKSRWGVLHPFPPAQKVGNRCRPTDNQCRLSPLFFRFSGCSSFQLSLPCSFIVTVPPPMGTRAPLPGPRPSVGPFDMGLYARSFVFFPVPPLTAEESCRAFPQYCPFFRCVPFPLNSQKERIFPDVDSNVLFPPRSLLWFTGHPIPHPLELRLSMHRCGTTPDSFFVIKEKDRDLLDRCIVPKIDLSLGYPF